MPFFDYRENNTGGHFTMNPASYVVIEAADADQANRIAETNGIYFDGIKNGRDCACCGDRWSRTYGNGDPTPMIYSIPIGEYMDRKRGYFDKTAIVFFLNGKIERFNVAPAPKPKKRLTIEW